MGLTDIAGLLVIFLPAGYQIPVEDKLCILDFFVENPVPRVGIMRLPRSSQLLWILLRPAPGGAHENYWCSRYDNSLPALSDCHSCLPAGPRRIRARGQAQPAAGR